MHYCSFEKIVSYYSIPFILRSKLRPRLFVDGFLYLFDVAKMIVSILKKVTVANSPEIVKKKKAKKVTIITSRE